ncbi:MAG: DUF4330 domain-containing protein [Oscillatoriales cyanobacterium]|nr:MAG: DUF4330 domain-containing protein [Oscillatoriales cyanobacterium]
MKFIDSHGRLFGKVSLLDLGAAIIIVMVAAAIFVWPGTGSGSLAQVAVNTKSVEVDTIVRGLSVRDPAQFIETLKAAGKTKIIIRNQPYGEVEIKNVQDVPRLVDVPQPDGTVAALPDPRTEAIYSVNLIVTLTGKAQMTDDGIVFGNNKVKIGTPIELEGPTYNFNSSTIDVRVLN